ncbi:MAG: shikimate kinase [Omnitrophica WOR_2 bacterium SM23_29]|nr:MAG: shikimate kinase [Omnitrophica WOR_2 bacterium SM23_29]
MKNIILVGFMGTGKTAVGKALAKRTRMKFVDMDDIIEKREGMKISDIFEKKGQPYFRDVEKEVTKDISKQLNLVIAAGGGVVIDEENVKNLKSNGIMICLTASPDKILERTKGYLHRPLLNVPEPSKRVSELLAKRAQYYARADHQIDTTNLNIDEIVQKILKII